MSCGVCFSLDYVTYVRLVVVLCISIGSATFHGSTTGLKF